MTRLPLFALILAGSVAAMPAAAQQTVEAEKINQVIVYGNDQCEQSSPDEIVVCNRLPETERYRVPEMLRGNPLDVRNEAWANKVVAVERVGRFGTDSCSPTGLGGFTGCTQQLVAGAKAERQAANKTDWQAMIADERAKRIAGIDAASDQVEAAVVAEERALAERQKAAEELERQASGQPPAPAAPDEADAAPLPTPPKP
jgi:murein DD-endopeptidase MepM/ murein hydrolase activator NlpD